MEEGKDGQAGAGLDGLGRGQMFQECGKGHGSTPGLGFFLDFLERCYTADGLRGHRFGQDDFAHAGVTAEGLSLTDTGSRRDADRFSVANILPGHTQILAFFEVD